MNKFSRLATIFSAALLAVLPLQSFALEISYPPFFPLTDTTSAPDLIKIFYQGMLEIGAAVAGVFVVIYGFKILTSRGSVSTTLEARSQILRVLAGLAILVGAILVLRTINPELANIRIDLGAGITPVTPIPPTVACTGPDEAAFYNDNLGRTLDETDIYINKMDPELSGASLNSETGQPYYPELLNDCFFISECRLVTQIIGNTTLDLLKEVVREVSGDLASCKSNLCFYNPTDIPYSTCQKQQGGCNQPLLADGTCPGNDYSYNAYCPSNPPGTATCGHIPGNNSISDPCPERNSANQLLEGTHQPTDPVQNATERFAALQTFWKETIKPQRDKITNCVVEQNKGYATLLTYGSALLAAQQPDQPDGTPGTNEVAEKCSNPNDTYCDQYTTDGRTCLRYSFAPCRESTDFFCTNAVISPKKFERLHLSLDDTTATRNGLLEKEEDFIKDIEGHSPSLLNTPHANGIDESLFSDAHNTVDGYPNACLCDHVQASSTDCAGSGSSCTLSTQGDVCGDPGTKPCGMSNCSDTTPGEDSNGCLVQMWTDLPKLVAISTRMRDLHDTLNNEMTHIDTLADVELYNSQNSQNINGHTYQSVYVKPCSTAKELASAVCPRITGGTDLSGACVVHPTICCPNDYFREDIVQCENEDFYSCLIASP